MRIAREKLFNFVKKVMMQVGCNEEKAEAVAEVLVEADMRGISSHGVARLKRYVNHIRQGIIDPDGDPEVVFETNVSAVVDGKDGVGHYVAAFSMKKAIEKAKENGMGMVAVRNSNHFGIAGYYAEMATKEGLIGVALTNTAPLVVHTGSREALLGSNPIAFAFPTGEGYPLLVDVSTSVVAVGKLEVCARLGKNMPAGWAIDERGLPTTDPARVLANLREKKGGGLLPLGGEVGGHKGYGLATLVELLTAGLSLGSYSFETYAGRGKVSHFFGALSLSLFGDPRRIMEWGQRLFRRLKEARKAEGVEKIFLPGEKEYEERERALREGVEVDEPTVEQLRALGEELKVPFEV